MQAFAIAAAGIADATARFEASAVRTARDPWRIWLARPWSG